MAHHFTPFNPYHTPYLVRLELAGDSVIPFSASAVAMIRALDIIKIYKNILGFQTANGTGEAWPKTIVLKTMDIKKEINW
jgi:hypothetical protein